MYMCFKVQFSCQTLLVLCRFLLFMPIILYFIPDVTAVSVSRHLVLKFLRNVLFIGDELFTLLQC